MEQGNTPIYKHIKLLSHYSNISNNEFDIPSIIFERFAYRIYSLNAAALLNFQSFRCGAHSGAALLKNLLFVNYNRTFTMNNSFKCLCH